LNWLTNLYIFVNNVIASIEDRRNKCSRGLMLPGLCSQGCADAVSKEYRVTTTSCSCNDTPIRVAFCTCNIICESVKEKKVLSWKKGKTWMRKEKVLSILQFDDMPNHQIDILWLINWEFYEILVY